MPRNLTDPNYDDTFEWQERVTDADGDSLSISVTIDGTDISNVAWADYTKTTNTINGDETEVLVDFTADRSGMSAGQTYQFEVAADDGLATTTRTFQLEVTSPYKALNEVWQGEGDFDGDGSIQDVDLSTATFNSEVDNLINVPDMRQKGDGNVFVVEYDNNNGNLSIYEYQTNGSLVGSTDLTALPNLFPSTGSTIAPLNDGTYIIESEKQSESEQYVWHVSGDGSTILNEYFLGGSTGGLEPLPNGNILAYSTSDTLYELDQTLSVVQSVNVDINSNVGAGREGNYIVVGGNNGLYVYDSNFNTRWTKTSVNYDGGVALADYIAGWDTTNQRWVVYDKSGNQQTTIGSNLSNIQDMKRDGKNSFWAINDTHIQYIDGTSEKAASNAPYGGQCIVVIV